MGQSESSTKEAAPAAKEAPAAEAPAAQAAPAAAPSGPSAAEILQALCKHADEVGHHVEKKQLMDYLAMDENGAVLDKDKHQAARAKFGGAVDEKGDIADKDKFIAACDVVAGKGKKKEGKEKAKAKAKPKIELGTKICIRNLAEDTTPEKLTTMFESFGKIEKVDLKTKEGGKCKGFGFIAFSSAEEASKAMADMNDKEADGKKLAVTLAFESQEGKGTEKGKGKGKDGKGADSKGKGKGKGKKGDNSVAAVQANYQAYQAQVQAWYNLQMHAAMMTQWQAAQMQGWYAQQSYGGSPKAGGVAAVGDGQEYTGTIKRITQRNGYGFIECADLKGKWKDDKNPEGRDIYVAANLIPETCKEPGSKVKFTLSFNSKGHPQAATCSPA